MLRLLEEGFGLKMNRPNKRGRCAVSSATGRPQWLRKENGEWRWAYSYMQKTADKGIQVRIDHAKGDRAPSYEMVVDVIAYLQETRDGLAFVTRLQNALRQRRHRSVNAKNNRKPYSFTLPIETKKAISARAKELKMSGEELVADLLIRAEKTFKEHRKLEQMLRHAVANERKRTKQLEERWKVKHDEAIRQIERLATLVTMWELTLGQVEPGFDGDDATLQSEKNKKVSAVKEAIADAGKKHELLEARLT